MTTRRGFLGAMLAACAAPAIVRADSLMRVIPTETEILLPEPKRIVHPSEFSIELTGPSGLRVGDVIAISGVLGLNGMPRQFTISGVLDDGRTLLSPWSPSA
jgi:hypothetical protein